MVLLGRKEIPSSLKRFTTVLSLVLPAVKLSRSEVDAFGAMKLPDGTTCDALRLVQDRRQIVNIMGVPVVIRSIVYRMMSRRGASVTVAVSDTTQPSFGVVTGAVSWSKPVVDPLISIPSDFSLAQNFPNPFNLATIIRYDMNEDRPIRLKIYNLLGQEIRELVNKFLARGSYATKWDGLDNGGNEMPTGVYIYRLEASDVSLARKMLLLR